jgi:bacillithiol system protein YtxJ
MNALVLDNESHLNEIETLSFQHPVAIFKHSTRCAVSAFVKKQVEREWYSHPHSFPLYVLDLLALRSVSNAIEKKFNIQHQSPQLIVIQSGKVVYAESHQRIDVAQAITSTLKLS